MANSKNAPQGIWNRTLKFLASLKLAVMVILGLAFSCATATVIESLHDIPTARYWVYHSWWFRLILFFLGVNILFVMVDRWPWKKKHIPFLLAHIGILLLLFGSWLTDKTGIDGNLRVTEGETTSVVELDQMVLVITEGDKVHSIPVKWIPPEVKFKPFSVRDYGAPFDLTVQDYITHADAIYDFVPKTPMMDASSPDEAPRPALKITVSGGPMRITQDFWLWTGDPSTAGFQAGPAWFELVDARQGAPAPASTGPGHGPKLSFRVEKGGVVSYHAESSSKEVVTGRVALKDLKGHEIDPHWKGVKIALQEFVPDAWVNTSYKISRMQHGDLAPPSAIRVVAGHGADQADVWLGIGSRALLRAGGHDVEVAYFHRRLMLPFAVRLDHFTIERYQGTMNPAAYSSKVTIFGGSSAPGDAKDPASLTQVISMNEPLEYRGITLYQASYEDAMPRPVTSILSVNRDPGRVWKYLGSLLIVAGSIWLFAVKYRRNRSAQAALKKADAQVASSEVSV